MKILLSAVIFASGFYGLFMNGCMKNPRHSKNLINYFTNLSNLIILAYQGLSLIAAVVPALRAFTDSSLASYSVTVSIMVTFFIYAFILYPEAKRKNDMITDAEKKGKVLTPNCLCVHYIVPILSLIYWIAFEMERIPFIYTVWSMAIPMAYTVYMCIRAALGINLPGRDTPYPYFYMNLDRLGPRKFTRNFIVSVLFMYVVALAGYGVTLLAK